MGRDTNNTIKRLWLGIALVFTAIFLPWQVPLAVSIFGIYRYERYVEVLFVAVLFDALYSADAGSLSGHAALLIAIAVYLAAFPFRKYLSIYKR